MKKNFLLLGFMFPVLLFSQSELKEKWDAYCDSVNAVFADAETSILLEEDLENFNRLGFFDYNDSWIVECKVKRIRNGKVFLMPTSTDRLPEYRPYAKLIFKHNGKKRVLTVYQNIGLMKNPDYADYLFLPFTDATNGEETYGGGRYMDLRTSDLESGTCVLDFNYCYNPYCAYNPRYSCPIPPSENDLPVRVDAGVKAFH